MTIALLVASRRLGTAEGLTRGSRARDVRSGYGEEKSVCGILAFIGVPPPAEAVLSALEAIRHRGQCGFGFWLTSYSEGIPSTTHCLQTGYGTPALVRSALDEKPSIFIGHWRYSTRGEHLIQNCQPIELDGGNAVIAHNGQLQFEGEGDSRISDTFRLARRIEAQACHSYGDRVAAALSGASGAAALVGADQKTMIAAQDDFAIRPLFFARYDNGYAVASEVPALTVIGAAHIDEVPPGAIIEFLFDGAPVVKRTLGGTPCTCAFEYIYFHSYKGLLNGSKVSDWRYRLGQQLAVEAPATADLLTSVPKSGEFVAAGYANVSRIPRRTAIICEDDSFRTFIERSAIRHREVSRKYTIDTVCVQGKSVVVVDDSVVRGETLGYLAHALRDAGATQVHARIGSPPFRHPCYFGIDIPDQKDLVSANVDTETVRRKLGLDTLAFLSVEGMSRALKQESLCKGCFTGKYPGLTFDRGDAADARQGAFRAA